MPAEEPPTESASRPRTGTTTPATDDPVRAVVADDSQFMRASIETLLDRHDVEVVATAPDGRAAVEAVREHQPDVVTMDIEMPHVDGIEATERIMDELPTPVVVLSAQAEDDADVTLEALQKGAVDYFTKPGGTVSTELQAQDEALAETVRTAATAEPTVADTTGETGPGPSVPAGLPEDPLLVVGASTGGPPVVERLLCELPVGADFRVLVVQHMAPEFTGGFAERLDRTSDYDVREAEDGDRIGGGEALVAPGGHHLRVGGYARGRLRVRLTRDPPEHGVRPAVDVTLRSVADRVGADAPVVAAVLTGMGEDGRDGVTSVADAGVVVAQDEATSVVFGMPQAAIDTGHVDSVVPEDRLASSVIETLTENYE